MRQIRPLRCIDRSRFWSRRLLNRRCRGSEGIFARSGGVVARAGGEAAGRGPGSRRGTCGVHDPKRHYQQRDWFRLGNSRPKRVPRWLVPVWPENPTLTSRVISGIKPRPGPVQRFCNGDWAISRSPGKLARLGFQQHATRGYSRKPCQPLSGSSSRKGVEVQVLSSAPIKSSS